MRYSKELLKGSTPMLVLSVLKRGDQYGYRIIRELEAASEQAFHMTEGTLYPILHALEKENYHVDIVVTHEPPLRIKGFLQLKDYDALRVTALNAYFEELSDSCTFDKWYFGSMHMDKYISSAHIAVFKNILRADTGEKV